MEAEAGGKESNSYTSNFLLWPSQGLSLDSSDDE
jgi:hypothetical protein